MCNCIENVQDRLKANAHKLPDCTNIEVKRVRLNNVAVMFQGGEQMSGIATLITEPYGKGGRTSKEINISFKYCPFCGEKYGTD